MKIRLLLAVLAVVVWAALPLSAGPILLSNPSFEQGTGSAFTFGLGVRCYDTGECGLPPAKSTGEIVGWTILGEVDYYGTYWQPADGARSIDLTGGPKTEPGWSGVSQDISTVAGWLHVVTFYLSGNPDNNSPGGGSSIKNLVVEAAGQTGTFTFDTSVITDRVSNMHWEATTWSFIAGGSSTTLVFKTMDSDYGPAIDNVSVAAIPEPGSMLLLGAGLFALAGFARRRFKR